MAEGHNLPVFNTDCLYKLSVYAVASKFLCFKKYITYLPENVLFDLYYQVNVKYFFLNTVLFFFTFLYHSFFLSLFILIINSSHSPFLFVIITLTITHISYPRLNSKNISSLKSNNNQTIFFFFFLFVLSYLHQLSRGVLRLNVFLFFF